MMPNEHRAFKLGLSAVMLWSTVATAFSISLRYLTPLQLVALASAVSWCFLSLRLLQPARWQALRATAMRDRLFGLAMGWLNPALYYLVLFAAYDRLPAQEAMAINYSWGITLALIAAPLLGQKLSLYSLLTCGISYFGIVVIATRGEPEALNFAQPEGVALALLSTLIWSLYWVINARKEIDPEVQLFLNFTGALPLLSALLWYQGAAAPLSWQGWAGWPLCGPFRDGPRLCALDGRDASNAVHYPYFQSHLPVSSCVTPFYLADRRRGTQGPIPLSVFYSSCWVCGCKDAPTSKSCSS